MADQDAAGGTSFSNQFGQTRLADRGHTSAKLSGLSRVGIQADHCVAQASQAADLDASYIA